MSMWRFGGHCVSRHRKHSRWKYRGEFSTVRILCVKVRLWVSKETVKISKLLAQRVPHSDGSPPTITAQQHPKWLSCNAGFRRHLSHDTTGLYSQCAVDWMFLSIALVGFYCLMRQRQANQNISLISTSVLMLECLARCTINLGRLNCLSSLHHQHELGSGVRSVALQLSSFIYW